MSKVIPNHVVRVGQTVCISPKEEHTCLQHPNDGLSCHTLPMQCFYYTVEGWDRKNLLAQTQGSSPTNKSVKSTVIVTPMPSQLCEDKYQQEEPTGPNEDSYPASPTLDISIENLNRLILEIDPTFKPLQQPTQVDSPLQTVPQSNASTVAKHEPDTSDIKYIEMSPGKTKYQESWQSSRSPSNIPFSVSSPKRGHLFPLGGNLGYNCDAVGNISGSVQHFCPTGRQSPTCIQVSESISIPQRDQKNFASYGSNSSLASSPGILQLRRMAQRCSEASVLSTSPGSDTSYIFGSSSSQSLSNHEPDTPLTRSIGSPSSVESLTGCYVPSNSSGSSYHRATCSQKENSSLTQPYQKGQTGTYTHSLLSVTNPPLPIPIVLINGLPEQNETAMKLSRGYSSSFKDKMPKTNSSSFSGVNDLNNSYSDNSSFSASSLEGYSQTTMKFVMDTSKYWFKPSITRDQAIQLLTDEPPGTFIMRDSTSYPGSFGLALKVFSNKAGEDAGNHIRHFLIESSPKGVHLKGTEEEPYFGSLSAFVYQHTIMPLALPCKLIIPSQAFLGDENPVLGSEASLLLSQKAAVCNLLYVHSVTMETLTGKAAVQKAVSSTLEQEILPTPTIVHFKVTALGITLTDIQRKIFFRRHYPLATISFCDMDPENRKWQKFSKTSRIFGVVSKIPADSENICHLFAEYDAVHPASHVVDFIQKLLLDF